MVRKLLIISLLMAAGCISKYTVSQGAFPKETGAVAADYMEMLEFHDSCWVIDSTHLEWEIGCKGDRQ